MRVNSAIGTRCEKFASIITNAIVTKRLVKVNSIQLMLPYDIATDGLGPTHCWDLCEA